MRLLLDTHILLWWLADHPALATNFLKLIRDSNNEIWVSAVSIWEIVIKQNIGKLKLPTEFPDLLAQQGFRSLSLTSAHAFALSELPTLHKDPFDRMLIAQAKLEQMVLVTDDAGIMQYDMQYDLVVFR